jgi:hypothetical protein
MEEGAKHCIVAGIDGQEKDPAIKPLQILGVAKRVVELHSCG